MSVSRGAEIASEGVAVRSRTRIICTLGPASASIKTIAAMTRAGMDVVRLNCSHATHATLRRCIGMVREVNRRRRRKIRVLLDLEGPRIRVGRLRGHNPIALRKKQLLWLEKGDFAGSGDVVPLDYKGPISDFRKAAHIFIDDGNICLKVLSAHGERVKTRVVVGGLLKEHKGVNLPGVHLSIPDITSKDIKDIALGVREGVDMIAQSFVRRAAPIREIRRIINSRLRKCAIVAKIENEEGIKNLGSIMEASDGIMVARGDLGVSLPVWEVPVLQKRIIGKCKSAGKFVITATQMLESMVENIRPTRAEVSDVANAILDGTDYVMLSAETAVGAYPVETVRMINEVIKFTESSEFYSRSGTTIYQALV